jgi:hypothetical protein
MSRLNVVVKQLAGCFHHGPVITASNLEEYIQAADIIERAHQEAAELRSRAEEYLDNRGRRAGPSPERRRRRGGMAYL